MSSNGVTADRWQRSVIAPASLLGNVTRAGRSLSRAEQWQSRWEKRFRLSLRNSLERAIKVSASSSVNPHNSGAIKVHEIEKREATKTAISRLYLPVSSLSREVPFRSLHFCSRLSSLVFHSRRSVKNTLEDSLITRATPATRLCQLRHGREPFHALPAPEMHLWPFDLLISNATSSRERNVTAKSSTHANRFET